MRLFEYSNYKLNIAPEVYTVKAFKDLVKRDRTVEKTQAEQAFSFIYFVYDPRSDLQYITDEDERISRAIELLGINDKFKVDEVISKAIEVYKSLTKTTSSMLLDDIKMSVDKIREYLRDASVNDDTFDRYTRAVERLIPLTEKVTNAEKVVVKEVEELSKMRGDKQQTLLDGGFSNFMK